MNRFGEPGSPAIICKWDVHSSVSVGIAIRAMLGFFYREF